MSYLADHIGSVQALYSVQHPATSGNSHGTMTEVYVLPGMMPACLMRHQYPQLARTQTHGAGGNLQHVGEA